MSLDQVLKARSVAVVGASRNESKRGYQAIRTLNEAKFEGQIYAVNPREESVLGLPCYPRLTDIEGPVDLALITTPAKTIPAIMEDCGAKGVSGAVLIAGGFGETGPEGRALEDKVLASARKNGVRLIGPNTSGMINVHSGLNLVGLRDVPKGDIALLSQSGNMALALITEASVKSRKGFSYYVGVGNEADIRFHEYLAWFRDDPDTRAILMYVEGMRDGRAFLQEAYKTTRHKPVIMLKSGRTATGRQSAGSHTGALAGMSEVARSAFKRVGVEVVEDSDELFPVAESLASLPPIRNNKVAILADGGGHATIAADILTEAGLEVPPLSERTQEKLRKLLPPAASLRNPVDVAGGADASPTVMADCARALLKDNGIGGLIVVGLLGGYAIRFAEKLAFPEEDAAHRIGKLVTECKKPVVVHSLYQFAKPHSLDLLRYYGIPVYDSVEVACKCLNSLAHYGKYLQSYEAKTDFVMNWGAKAKPSGRTLIDRARAEGRDLLLEHEAREMLALHGAPMGEARLAHSADEAEAAAKELGGDLALKIVSPQILHKSDAGGVQLSISGGAAARQAYEEITGRAQAYAPDAEIRGVLISPMAAEGLEVIIGTKTDDQFGPVIMFGIGGIMVEVLHDVAFRVLPISNHSAKKMLGEIRSARMLTGYRGRPPVDKKALRRLLLTVSEIVEAYPEIVEMDLNPVIAHDKGVEVVDARILLKPA
jgi:acyl-CoA synthetase (NDP forming)